MTTRAGLLVLLGLLVFTFPVPPCFHVVVGVVIGAVVARVRGFG